MSLSSAPQRRGFRPVLLWAALSGSSAMVGGCRAAAPVALLERGKYLPLSLPGRAELLGQALARPLPLGIPDPQQPPEADPGLSRLGAVRRFLDAAEIVAKTECPVVDKRIPWSDLPDWWHLAAVQAAVDGFRSDPQHAERLQRLAGLWVNCDEPPCMLVTAPLVPFSRRPAEADGAIHEDPDIAWMIDRLSHFLPVKAPTSYWRDDETVVSWAISGWPPEGEENAAPPECPLGAAQTRRELEMLDTIDVWVRGYSGGYAWARTIHHEIHERIREQ